MLADIAPAMVWSTGPDLRGDYFNRSWLDFRGRTLEQETGQGWQQGIHPDDLAGCLKARESICAQGRHFQIEYRLQRHDGIYRWLMETAGPRFWPSGAFRGCIGWCTDVHERKLAEENLRDANTLLSRQNKELIQFAYAANHDLKEPLRTIANYSQLLAKHYRQGSDVRPLELLSAIFRSVQRMQLLTDSVLEYSQVMHRSELRMVDLDCNVLLDEVLLACQGSIKESGAVVTHDPLPVVRADEAQLGQVLQNLISNAIKFRRSDARPHIHVSSSARPEEFLFEVADDGIGFDAQYSERIFGLFKRLHGRDEYSGTGIGLAICRKLIERHGGRIWAESAPNQGARFFFTLQRTN